MTLDPEGGFDQLMALGRGFQAAKMLNVAVELAVFDFLEEPHSAVEAAAWLKADGRAVGIFLNGLAALGLLVKGVDYFRNSKLAARFLVQGREGYRGTIISHMAHTWERGWNDLKDTILVGHPEGVEPESWVDTRPKRDEETMRAFIQGMHALARDLAPQVTPKLNLTGVHHLLDLGGGPATYAITFALANPDLKATVFDLPGPIGIARANIAKNGLDARINTLTGNFLQDDIGSGYDYIWVSHILHSHNEAQCRLIIKKSVAALVSGGRLAIQDFYLNPDGYTPPGAAMFGVHMLAVTPRGRAYTYGEVAEWLQEEGLTTPEHLQTSPEASVLVGRKK
jgi:hypothetical protein